MADTRRNRARWLDEYVGPVVYLVCFAGPPVTVIVIGVLAVLGLVS